MSISTLITRKAYACNGSLQDFAVTFAIEQDTDLTVTLVEDATGDETDLSISADYTVSPGADVDYKTGSTVTTVATYASGFTLVIERSMTLTQETNFEEGGPLSAEAIENAFDRGVMLQQQQGDNTERSLKFPTTDSGAAGTSVLPNDAARKNGGDGSFPFFNGTDGGVGLADGVSSVAVSAAMTPVVQAASLAAGRTAFSVYSEAETDAAIAALSTSGAFSANVVGDADYTILDGDGYTDIQHSPGAVANTITLPTAADNSGRRIRIMKMDSAAGAVIVDGEGAEAIINGGWSFTSVELWYQYDYIELFCTGTAWLKVNSPAWRKIEDPTTGFWVQITTWTAADDFDQGEDQDFSAETPLGSLAVMVPITPKTTTGNIFQRRKGDTNVSNTPNASSEFHSRVTNGIGGANTHAVLWLGDDGIVELTPNGLTIDLDILPPFCYLW